MKNATRKIPLHSAIRRRHRLNLSALHEKSEASGKTHVICTRPYNFGRSTSTSTSRNFSNSGVKVLISDDHIRYDTDESSQTNVERLASISLKIDEIASGDLENVEVREACEALSSLAHSMNEHDVTNAFLEERGRIAWNIFRRLLVEDNLYDALEDDLLPIHGYPIIIDHTVCHNAHKSMLQSKDSSLIRRAESTIKAIGDHYISAQSKKIRPVGRSYAMLINAVKDIPSYSDVELVEKVQSLLDDVKEQEEMGNFHVTMNRHIFNAALNTLASRAESSPLAVDMIENMISEDGAPLDQASFSISIKSILSSKAWIDKTEDMATSIENLLAKMEKVSLLPSQSTMTPILTALSKRGNVNELLRLLSWMENMYQTRGWKSIRPNKIHFNTIISASSRSDLPSVACGDQAMRILDYMKDLYTTGNNIEAKPDLVTYNSVLNAIAKESSSNNSKQNKNENDNHLRAESLLARMEAGSEGDDIVPDRVSYNTVLSSYMNSNMRSAAAEAQGFLQRMAEHDIEPDLLSYTMCINALAKSKMKGSAQKAEDLLNTMEQAYAEGNTKLKPDMICYNSTIHAYANSAEKDGIEKAANILKRITVLRQNGDRPDLIPDAVSYTSIISALAKRNDKKSTELLDDLITLVHEHGSGSTLDSGVYNALIYAQIQNDESGSAEKAENLLLSMLDGDQDAESAMIRPNTITFNTVIDAWSKSKQKDSAARAELLLKKMQKLHEDGYEDVSPDTFSFASVLNALANSSIEGSAEKAEKVLDMQQQLYKDGNQMVKPNAVCFSTVIKAYSRSKTSNAAERAESILKKMFEFQKEGNMDVQPNTITFTSVCNAWAKSNSRKAAKKIEELIMWMKELDEKGFKNVAPNEYTYNALIAAVARSKDPKKATTALAILRKMQENPRFRNNSFTYGNVMKACSFTRGTASIKNTALKIAIIILEEAVETAGPTDRLNVIYGAFFQTTSNLMQKEAEKVKIEKLVETVFHQCCDRGQVDEMLLVQVRRSCSKQLFLRLFGQYKSFPNVDIRDIPVTFRENVQKKR